jgi:hypothetical protein
LTGDDTVVASTWTTSPRLTVTGSSFTDTTTTVWLGAVRAAWSSLGGDLPAASGRLRHSDGDVSARSFVRGGRC